MKPYRINLEWDENDFYQNQTGISRLPTPDVVAEKSSAAWQGTLDLLRQIGQDMAENLQTMPLPPSEVELEFGLRLAAESGVITKSQEQAHFVVKLVWKS